MQYFELKWTDRSESHIARHGITPSEVEEVLSSQPLIVSPGRQSTKLVQGQTYAGRHLTVVLSVAEDGRFFVVTARNMTLQEVRQFRKKR